MRKGKQKQITNTDIIASVAIVALLIMVPLGLTGQNALRSINLASVAQADVADCLGKGAGLRRLRVNVREHVVDVQLSDSGEIPDINGLERVLSDREGTKVEVWVELFPRVILTSGGKRSAPGEETPQSAHGVDDSGSETRWEGNEDGALE